MLFSFYCHWPLYLCSLIYTAPGGSSLLFQYLHSRTQRRQFRSLWERPQELFQFSYVGALGTPGIRERMRKNPWKSHMNMSLRLRPSLRFESRDETSRDHVAL